MEVKFTDTFFESLQKMVNRQRWYWKAWDFLRYDLPEGIKNLRFFFPVIWRYRDWDYNFQLRILKKSLEPLAERLRDGNEVEDPRMKKVAKIERAVEILGHIADDTYIDIAAEQLGYGVDTSYGLFGDKPDSEEPLEIKEANRKLFSLSHDIEQKEWNELWEIFKGQEPSHYTMFRDKVKEQGGNDEDSWNRWYNGTGMNRWWD